MNHYYRKMPYTGPLYQQQAEYPQPFTGQQQGFPPQYASPQPYVGQQVEYGNPQTYSPQGYDVHTHEERLHHHEQRINRLERRLARLQRYVESQGAPSMNVPMPRSADSDLTQTE